MNDAWNMTTIYYAGPTGETDNPFGITAHSHSTEHPLPPAPERIAQCGVGFPPAENQRFPQ